MAMLHDLLAMTAGAAVMLAIVWSVCRVHDLRLFSEESRKFMHTGSGFLTLWVATIAGLYTMELGAEAARTWPEPALSFGQNPLFPFGQATALTMGLWLLPSVQRMFSDRS